MTIDADPARSLAPTVRLADGAELPRVGLGTYSLTGEAGAAGMAAALDAGYRLLDSAQGYGNEDATGEAVRRSRVPREDVVVTTKLPNDAHGYDATRASFERSVQALGIDVVDLYLIHWPEPEQDRFVDSWRAMIELREAGRIRSIGVSNFSPEQIDRLERETGVLPVVNQVELHVGLDQADLRAYHRERGIVTESYSPLKHGTALAAHPAVTRIAEAHGVGWNQVVLRWNLQLDTVVIPRSKDDARRAANLDLFGFTLSDDEAAEIGAIRL
jgi:diketogulonate reductase-like aldo/keto reductase